MIKSQRKKTRRKKNEILRIPVFLEMISKFDTRHSLRVQLVFDILKVNAMVIKRISNSLTAGYPGLPNHPFNRPRKS